MHTVTVLWLPYIFVTVCTDDHNIWAQKKENSHVDGHKPTAQRGLTTKKQTNQDITSPRYYLQPVHRTSRPLSHEGRARSSLSKVSTLTTGFADISLHFLRCPTSPSLRLRTPFLPEISAFRILSRKSSEPSCGVRLHPLTEEVRIHLFSGSVQQAASATTGTHASIYVHASTHIHTHTHQYISDKIQRLWSYSARYVRLELVV